MLTFRKIDLMQLTEDEWKDLHQLRRKIHLEDTPEDPIIEDTSYEERMKDQISMIGLESFFYFIYNDKNLVGVFFFVFFNEASPSYQSNKNLVIFNIDLLKDYRRRGIGTKAIKIMLDICEKNRRSNFIVDTKIPETNKFFEAIGAKIAQKEEENRLKFSELDWQMIVKWTIEGQRENPKTKIVTVEGSIPEIYVDEFLKTYNETINLQPKDEVEMGEIRFTKEQLRKREQSEEQGNIKILTTITIEENGEVSAYTQLGRIPGREKLLSQYLTGVPLKYRGKKLGKWVKAQMLAYTKENYPDTEAITTMNSESNDAMLHINNKLGFTKYKEQITAQVTLDQLKAYIQTKSDLDIQIRS